VVGYDNSHGDHHRHFAGAEEKFAFVSYERLLERSRFRPTQERLASTSGQISHELLTHAPKSV
jgi:hypothetical protein